MGNLVLIGVVGNYYSWKGEFNFILEYRKIEALPYGMKVKIGYSPNFSEEYTIEHFQKKNNRAVAKLVEINDKEGIEKLRNQGVFADEEEIQKHNSKFISSNTIVGCKVIDIANGNVLGEIVEIWELPANDVWLVRTDFGELPLPVIEDVIVETDFANKLVKINVIDGLLDLTHNRGAVDED